MSFISNIINRASHNKKRIVLPETMDGRVLDAAKIVIENDIADIILIGDRKSINIPGATVIDPLKDIDLTSELVEDLYELRKHKGMTREEAASLLIKDYMYYACMLVKTDRADGVVSGACHSTSNTLRPALQIIKTAPDVPIVSAFFLMNVPNCKLGADGTFIFADSGLNQNPTSEELAYIAGESAKSFKLLVEKDPIVALLSHSTMGSAEHPDVDKVVKATKIAKEKYHDFIIDGELQLDAAIVPEVSMQKAPNSLVGGLANVLIFPDLDAGNIGYKLVERLGKAAAYGPITQGIARPINDLSRGCSVNDIVGVVAITAVQAQNTKK